MMGLLIKLFLLTRHHFIFVMGESSQGAYMGNASMISRRSLYFVQDQLVKLYGPFLFGERTVTGINSLDVLELRDECHNYMKIELHFATGFTVTFPFK